MRRKDFFDYKNFTIDQSHAAMPVGTDSDLLGTLSFGGSKILDIGTGTGIISLMLAQRYPQATIHAIEIDENASIDALNNFERSPFKNRISFSHISFQDYLLHRNPPICFDSIVCNPPYFHQSKECDDVHRSRARHSSSLPFEVLTDGAYSLLSENGFFSVCIPPEVFDLFCDICYKTGFKMRAIYKVRSFPGKDFKRFVITFMKCLDTDCEVFEGVLRNNDLSRSDWYINLMKDFLTYGPKNHC